MNEGFVAYTKENINLFRLLSLRSALKLEIVGMKRRGRSAYSIIKEEFGLTGNKKSVLLDLEQLIEQKKDENSRSIQKDKKVESTAFVPLSRQDSVFPKKEI